MARQALVALLSGACLLLLSQSVLCKVTIQDFFSEFRNKSDRFIKQRSVFTSQMTDLYYPEAIPCYCAGAGGSSDRFIVKGEASEEFCTWSPYRWPGLFNQYLMEYIMLRKWNKRKDWEPSSGADVVVIPSYLHHYVWKHSHTKDWGRVTKVCGQIDELRSYWSKIVEKYYEPKAGKNPWIVVHYSYAWDTWNDRFLRTLYEQPVEFVNRVIISSLDGSNLPILLKQRLSSISSSAKPILMAMPYPTGVLRPIDFTRNTSTYDASRIRPLHVSFEGMFRNLRRLSPVRSWIYKEAYTIQTKFEVRRGTHRALAVLNTDFPNKNRQNAILKDFRLWEVVANSNFCLEPDGDTPTRSHLFVAVQAGCIPVLFDHSSDKFYSGERATEWPFRFSPEPYRLNYEEFCVVYNADEVSGGKVDVFTELVEMPTKEPERFAQLRRGLAKAGRWLTYLYKAEQNPATCMEGVCDAFGAYLGALDKTIL